MRRRAGAGILALSSFVALHLYLNSSHFRLFLLARVQRSLATELGSIQLGDRFSVDWIGRVTAGPLTVAGEEGTILTVGSATVRASYLPLLIGRFEPAAITLDEVDVEIDRARNALTHLPQRRGAKFREPDLARRHVPLNVSLRVNEIHLRTDRPRLQRILRTLDGLSGKFAIQRSPSDWKAQGTLHFGQGARSTLDARLLSDGTMRLRMDAEVPSMGETFDPRDELPFAISHGRLFVQLTLDSNENLRRGQASFAARVQELQLDGERLDSKTIGPLNLTGGASVDWDSAQGQIQLTGTEIGIAGYAPLPLEIHGRLQLGREPNLDLEAKVQKLDVAKLLRTLPPQLSPGGDVPSVAGTVSAQFVLKGPSLQPSNLELAAKLDLTGLHPSPVPSSTLTGPFEYQPSAGRDEGPAILVGERNPDFLPLNQIPPLIVNAVLLSEDAGFWGHHGFDFQEIKGSLVDAAEEKRFRGASTVTQQLAKNLYFSREKTYARKIREAIATVALEASLPKSRILEIYLNIIEWGPGIYGLAQAARHYFRREVGELTPKQAAFLATIIPNPIKYYAYYRQGALSEVWERRVHELLIKMKERGFLSEAEFTEADGAPIGFVSSKENQARAKEGATFEP